MTSGYVLMRSRYITDQAINLGIHGLCLIAATVTMFYCKLESYKKIEERVIPDWAAIRAFWDNRNPHFRYAISKPYFILSETVQSCSAGAQLPC
jgi:hypothetical protein